MTTTKMGGTDKQQTVSQSEKEEQLTLKDARTLEAKGRKQATETHGQAWEKTNEEERQPKKPGRSAEGRPGERTEEKGRPRHRARQKPNQKGEKKGQGQAGKTELRCTLNEKNGKARTGGQTP